MPPPSWSRRARVQVGPGISPSSRAPVLISENSLYVILDLFGDQVVGGWSRVLRWMRTWPSASWRRPVRSRASRRTNSPFTRTAVAHAQHTRRCSSRTWVSSSHSRPRVSDNVLRSAVPDREVPQEFPARLARSNTRVASAGSCLRGTTTDHLSGEVSDARRVHYGRAATPGGPSPLAPDRLCRPSRAVRRATPTRDNGHGGLDQSAADPHQPGGPSHDHRQVDPSAGSMRPPPRIGARSSLTSVLQ